MASMPVALLHHHFLAHLRACSAHPLLLATVMCLQHISVDVGTARGVVRGNACEVEMRVCLWHKMYYAEGTHWCWCDAEKILETSDTFVGKNVFEIVVCASTVMDFVIPLILTGIVAPLFLLRVVTQRLLSSHVHSPTHAACMTIGTTFQCYSARHEVTPLIALF
eukprot:10790598-Ditylum_brightwellii.AAC.1